MSDNIFTIKSYNSLSPNIFECIERLNSYMPEYELYYEESSPCGEDAFFAAWKDGRIIGFFSFIYVPKCNEAEITALVEPDMRHMGVFSALLAHARLTSLKLGITHFYYAPVNAGSSADSTQAMPSVHSAAYSHSEYLLRLDCGRGFRSDADNGADAVADKLAGTGLFYHEDEDTDAIFCCITDSDDNILSSCYLSDENSYMCIWGVGTDFHHRRKGFASLLMQCIIASAIKASNDNNMPAPVFMLQVSGRNTAAMNLYKKYGFLTESRIDYYSLHS